MSEQPARLEAIDVFRGITVAAMLLVNNPGSWAAIYPPLRHAEWHGWTPTDLIFPFFLFIVGITTCISLAARRARGATDGEIVRKILTRGSLIILIGLALNAFPFFSSARELGTVDAALGDRIAHRFEHLRLTGVLQRIGVVYIAAGLLTLRTSRRQQVAIIAAILGAYWVIMTLLPVPGTGTPGWMVLDERDATMAAYFDRLLLAPDHIYKAGKTWDPEGPLSTLPAVATTMLGFICGSWLTREQRTREWLVPLFVAGAIGTVAGQVWGWLFPINKNLWTSSYVIFTAGAAALMLAAVLWLQENSRAWRRIAQFFLPFGVNPMLAFVGSGIMARLIGSLIKVPYGEKTRTLQPVLHETLFASWLSPRAASLAFALSFVTLWFVLLLPLQRRRIYWRV